MVPLTTNLKWARVGGTVLLRPREGLRQQCVANVSQLAAVDRAGLLRRVARVTHPELDAIMAGIDFMLGQES